jgi:hypothetical protein
MGSGIVRAAMSSILLDKKFVQSTRSDKMRFFGQNVLATVIKGDHEMELFDKFSEEIISSIEEIFTNIPKSMHSQSLKKSCCLSAFHRACSADLQILWQNLLTIRS